MQPRAERLGFFGRPSAGDPPPRALILHPLDPERKGWHLDRNIWIDARIPYDREPKTFHVQREISHRGRPCSRAEREKLTAIRDSFKTAADTALDLASRKALPLSAPSPDIGRRPQF